MVQNFMTFNLKYDFTNGNANGWGDRVKRINKVITDNEPLCVGTQEGLIHMLTDMDNLLDEYSWIGEAREGADRGEFNSIFYKNNELELIEWSQFWLSETPEVKGSKSWGTSLPRICTWAQFRDKVSGREFRVYNTHLDHESELAREEGIKVILNFVRESYKENKVPFMIMGDFNCFINEKVFKIVEQYNNEELTLKNVYKEAEHSIEGTFHDFKGGYDGGIIDFILISKEFNCIKTFIDDRVIDGGYPSDHYAVISTLSME